MFAKPPLPGQVKTRLATRWGGEHAAALARAFLQDTWALSTSIEWADSILATTEGEWRDFGLPGRSEVWLQGEGDLGQRLERIARTALAEVDLVLLIGADSPGLPRRLLDQAREALAGADAVLGPCEDGGFYLLGLRRCPPGLLEELTWSTSSTCAATRARLQSRDLKVDTIETWFDVDEPADLERLRSCLAQGAVCAPQTARLLMSLAARGASCPST